MGALDSSGMRTQAVTRRQDDMTKRRKRAVRQPARQIRTSWHRLFMVDVMVDAIVNILTPDPRIGRLLPVLQCSTQHAPQEELNHGPSQRLPNNAAKSQYCRREEIGPIRHAMDEDVNPNMS